MKILPLLLLTSCGYSVAAVNGPDGEPYRVAVLPINEPGLSVDAGGVVDAEVRAALFRQQGIRVSGDGAADGKLQVEVLDVRTNLGAFAEPNLRAARYEVRVLIRGRLESVDGGVWTTPAAVGSAPFISTPGAMEALDGATRRALSVAARQAADRLVMSLLVRLRQQ